MTQVNVTISGRVYPLRIRNEEVNVVREAEELINQKINEYRTSYDGKDAQDYLSMVLMNFAVDLINKRAEGSAELETLTHKLEELETVLSS